METYQNSRYWSAWQTVGIASEKAYCKAADGKTDLGADPGNLLHLHLQGWEHVHSHVVPQGDPQGFIVVLRRRV